MLRNRIAALLTLLCLASAARAQTTAFTYQGSLLDNGVPVNGIFDVMFTIRTDPILGSVVGGPVTNSAVNITNGIFVVPVDFGAGPFNGGNRWIEVAVRPSGGGEFQVLSPRQQVTSAPYSVRAENANFASLASGVVNGSLFSTAFADGAVTTAKIADSAVTSAKIVNGTIVNADVSDTAAIVDTKLATIATAGKVANSATTATSANTPNSIVMRDAGGAFVASTVRADLVNSVSTDLEVQIAGQRVTRFQFPAGALSPNLIGGHSGNQIAGGSVGSVISGGGIAGNLNEILGGSDYSAIAGGYKNKIESDADVSLIAGGNNNTVTGGARSAIVGGQLHNMEPNVFESAILAGYDNHAQRANDSAIVGGFQNRLGDFDVGDGAIDSAIVAGKGNTIRGKQSVILGGNQNNIRGGATNSLILAGEATEVTGSYSVAGGRNARAGHSGTFVWADSQLTPFDSTAANQFLIRADGGVGINTASPQATLHVNGSFRVGDGTSFWLIQSGQGVVTNGSPTAKATLTVTFPTPFSAAPKVLATAAADPGYNVDDTFVVTVRSVSNTQVVFNILRVDSPNAWAQWLRINWMAWQ